MTRLLFSFCLLACVLGIIDNQALAAEEPLQLQIDTTKEGGTLYLKNGIYHEPIVIEHPLTLIGETGVIFEACSSQPMITVKGNNVHLKNITIKTCKDDKSPSSIHVSGRNHQLEDLYIHTHAIGVQLNAAEGSLIRNIKIIGQNRGNGVDLWESHSNIFDNNQIEKVEDGFYLENSHHNRFIYNTVRNSRYGLHVMFSNNITIKENTSTQNFTGAMVMGSNKSIITGNKLMDNNQNVNAQGILLYDVHESIIQGNIISNNRVGMYLEDSSGNEIRQNEFAANFIGAQINKVNNNLFEHNAFFRNIVEFQAKEETNNNIHSNYWDAAWKLDTDGDGNSNLLYQADPYFLHLIRDFPEYQLFFQHPGMQLLQKMLKSPKELLVTDSSPLMEYHFDHQVQQHNHPSMLWIISLVMILSSLFLIYIGRKKT